MASPEFIPQPISVELPGELVQLMSDETESSTAEISDFSTEVRQREAKFTGFVQSYVSSVAIDRLDTVIDNQNEDDTSVSALDVAAAAVVAVERPDDSNTEYLKDLDTEELIRLIALSALIAKLAESSYYPAMGLHRKDFLEFINSMGELINEDEKRAFEALAEQMVPLVLEETSETGQDIAE